MPHRTPAMPPLQLPRLTPLQHRALQFKDLLLDFQLWLRKEVLLTGTRFEVVSQGGLTEG